MTKLLKCVVSDGMFSDEVTVTVSTTTGEQYAFFVPADATDRQRKFVRVEAVFQDGGPIVRLPDDRQSVVHVRAEDLQTQ